MALTLSETLSAMRFAAQRGSEGVILLLAVALTGASLGAAFGLWPWAEVPARIGAQNLPGYAVQLAATVLMLALVSFLPASRRMSRLEGSHRSFAMGMEDVARAYRLAHAADRTGVFALSGEFDSMRARLAHLRQHPDLRDLEPELLELAAEMSFLSRDLARVYAEDRVARARAFLAQRQEEVEGLTDRLAAARRTCDELRRWLTDIEADERLAQTQIRRLEADLHDILPTLGYDFDLDDPGETNVVPLNKPLK